MSWYHPVKIGNLELTGNLFLAPIAGYSDKAFRTLCVECGASFCTTEMVSAEALVRGNKKTVELMSRSLLEKAYAVQIFGGNAEVMSKATEIVLSSTDCDCIDINGGCPVPKITKTGAGSMLTKEPERLFSIVKAVKEKSLEYAKINPQRGNVPVTIKIRSGWDSSHITWKECAQAALDAGADAITIHARTKAQGYSGNADWEIQRQLVEFINGRIPVFGSGDAKSPETALEMFEKTNVDGIMFARGAMGDPFLFKRTIEYLTTGTYKKETYKERILSGFKELEINVQEKGEKSACLQMRKKFCAYCSGMQGSSQIRRQIVMAASVQDYKNAFSSYLE